MNILIIFYVLLIMIQHSMMIIIKMVEQKKEYILLKIINIKLKNSVKNVEPLALELKMINVLVEEMVFMIIFIKKKMKM